MARRQLGKKVRQFVQRRRRRGVGAAADDDVAIRQTLGGMIIADVVDQARQFAKCRLKVLQRALHLARQAFQMRLRAGEKILQQGFQ